MSQPSSPHQHGHADIQVDPLFSSPRPVSEGSITRTVAIIKNHALEHRFDIEHRIQEAKFEIVKERQMEFDVESDPEYLYELFGEDADSLGEGPVWVYVLERRRAVETWEKLMGPSDPELGREQGSQSLRALYGISTDRNGVMGATDVQTAELQIASLFASSPPFPTSDLPPDDASSRFNTMKSMSSSVMAELQQMVITDSDDGVFSPQQSNLTSPTSTSTGKLGSSARKSGNFKARPLPATHAKPDIAPRTSRAALLRAGIVLEKDESKRPRGVPLSKEEMARTFANVPGHKRSTTIAVASTAAPKIAPRMTRAASLRVNGGVEPQPIKRRPSLDAKSSFEGVPGHKRRETISVASVTAPVVAPRLNRSAQLRAQKDNAPPSSFMFRAPSTPKVPGMSRSNSQASNHEPVSRPSSQASFTSAKPARPTSAAAVRSAPKPVRPASSSGVRSTSNATATPAAKGNPAKAAPAPPKLRARPSSVGAPTIAPRSNRSAELRATKKALEEEEAAAAAARAKRASAKPLARRPSMAQAV